MNMKFGKLREVTGRFVKDSYERLEKARAGCCSVCFASDDRYDYAVCIGWTATGGTEYAVAAKVGRQTRCNIMQCDFDFDFEMPCRGDGEVDDTEHVFDGKPETMKEWNRIASRLRKDARRMKEYAEGDWHMYK